MVSRAAACRTATAIPQRARCQHHARQDGLTLIETVVAVAVLAVGVVGIGAGVAASEKIAHITQNQSQLELSMRQLSDWVRNSSSLTCTSAAGGCPSLPYASCATNTNTYNASVANAEAAGALNPSIGSTPIQAVKVSTSASRMSASGSVSIPALTICGVGIGDWGVQEITLRVSVAGNTVRRVVWKSAS